MPWPVDNFRFWDYSLPQAPSQTAKVKYRFQICKWQYLEYTLFYGWGDVHSSATSIWNNEIQTKYPAAKLHFRPYLSWRHETLIGATHRNLKTSHQNQSLNLFLLNLMWLGQKKGWNWRITPRAYPLAPPDGPECSNKALKSNGSVFFVFI